MLHECENCKELQSRHDNVLVGFGTVLRFARQLLGNDKYDEMMELAAEARRQEEANPRIVAKVIMIGPDDA